MNVLVVYCHPSEQSFTHAVKDAFLQGLTKAGHTYTLSDLYAMRFNETISEVEYLRETNYRSEIPVAEDVAAEQDKIQAADAIVFIYPVFWTEAPAKLVGWFDRVWTSGFAYSPNPTMKTLQKALFIACAGKSQASLEETGELTAMKTVMLGDRIRDRALEKDLILLDNITRWDDALRNETMPIHIETAYNIGLRF